MPMRLTVVVPTYRRPATLAASLEAVLAQVNEAAERDGIDVGVLVVDNDAAGSARDTVAAVGSPVLRYVGEPEPGISAARNRGLDECADRDLLVFVDDDETPDPGWLEQLVRTWALTEPAAVVGLVRPRYQSTPDPWIVAGGFFVRARHATGTEVGVAATNNLLLDVRQVRAMGIRFDPRFGLTGGEDTMFSRQLVAGGGRIVWCDEAVVVDLVPDGRANRRWVLDRARRAGNSGSVIDLVLAEPGAARALTRARTVVRGLVRLLGGHARHLMGLALRDDRHQARGLRTASRGRGMLDAVSGHVIEEYGRG